MITSLKPLLAQLSSDPKARHPVGRITNRRHRTRAISTLRQGGTVQFIIGNKQSGVGGIFFDIDNPRAVDIVIRAKSTPRKTRQSMFALMTPHEHFYRISDLKYPLDLSHLSLYPCFIRIPVKNPQQFPAHAISLSSLGHPVVQTFPSDLVPHFREFVREAADAGIRVGGTSLNYTGQGNLTRLEDVARFFAASPGRKYWLDTPARFTGVSWTIIELHPRIKQVITHREGDSPSDIIAAALFASQS